MTLINPTDKSPAGTSLKGYLTATYQELVERFGPPNADGDDYKVAFEWVLEVDGEIATIYPWKNTSLYESGYPSIEQMKATNTDWHIGGHSIAVVAKLGGRSAR